ncbi:cell division protein ZapA [Blochmannia endosymbiont of Camponotus (Colobopsis) obliquus]|uniref:cell division protein ZapA n=1 Tax=Blochmannia endosymbiont of Camponotus (Colobopsis) obliquus TaxID=1505597 RepID=UPI00061A79E0|nr:cell division protein ZapA [Blochmannia endosymbiont of Camponotus (Colobopsis) obliquus]AKC60422.1 Cell division protein ZapA [Blochmannia endosymbiont of Camponotus (Colobopsis) obliquus]
MSLETIEIHLCGRALKVNCPPNQQNALSKAAANLNNRLNILKERSKITNTEHLAFITALNICHELEEEKNKIKAYANNMEKHIRLLQETIEQLLIKHHLITESININFK